MSAVELVHIEKNELVDLLYPFALPVKYAQATIDKLIAAEAAGGVK